MTGHTTVLEMRHQCGAGLLSNLNIRCKHKCHLRDMQVDYQDTHSLVSGPRVQGPIPGCFRNLAKYACYGERPQATKIGQIDNGDVISPTYNDNLIIST
jgi:hypothetical protein